MNEYYVDVTVRLRIRTPNDPVNDINESDYQFTVTNADAKVIDTRIIDVNLVGDVHPESGALIIPYDDLLPVGIKAAKAWYRASMLDVITFLEKHDFSGICFGSKWALLPTEVRDAWERHCKKRGKI